MINKIINRNGNQNFTDSIHYHYFNILKFSIKSLFSYPREIINMRNYISRIHNYSNSGKDRIALLIGNGPSQKNIEKLDFQELKENNVSIFTMNQFFYNDFFLLNKPTDYIVSDFLSFKDEYLIDIGDKFKLDLKKNFKKRVEYLSNSPEINIHIPAMLIKDVERLKLKNKIFPFINSRFIINSSKNQLLPSNFMPQTLLFLLRNVIYANFKKIYLIGFDYDYFKNLYLDNENSCWTLEKHSHEKDRFIQNPSDSKIDFALFEQSRIFYQIKMNFKKHKYKILNLNKYSMIDAFKKMDYEPYELSNSNILD